MKDKLRVFIVDDSTVFRSQIRAALEGQPEIEVIGFATDGHMACEALKNKKADVVTLDLEMPVMNGLETLAELKRSGTLPYVIVFSSQTKSGAEATLTALQSGASDFLLKPKLDGTGTSTPAQTIRDLLMPKLAGLISGELKSPAPPPPVPAVFASGMEHFPRLNWKSFNPTVVVIASSTGGPNALEQLFSKIRAPLRCPILITQHMPPVFTTTLAERLHRVSGLPVTEGVANAPVLKGHVYIAPGDYHMSVGLKNSEPVILLNQDPLRNSVRPAADFLFESAARVFGNATMGVVLTGMGSDGRDGALAIKRAGGGIAIQSKESCIVFGMPGAVFQENAYDHIFDIDGLAHCLSEMCLCTYEKRG